MNSVSRQKHTNENIRALRDKMDCVEEGKTLQEYIHGDPNEQH